MRWPEPSSELVTLRDAIGDLPPVPGGQRAERLPYRAAARRRASLPAPDAARPAARSSGLWIHDHMTRAVRRDDWEAYTGLLPGQTYADIPEHLQRYRTDIFTDKYKRLSWHELSRTITAHIAKDGYWYIHPEQHRTLSIREAARLQTFPDWFRFAGQPSHRYAQIGNAVPPLVAEAVGRALLRSLAKAAATGQLGGPRARPSAGMASRASRRTLGGVRADPWLVLAGELALERAASRRCAQAFDALRTDAPSPRSLLALARTRAALVDAIGMSAHAARSVVAAADCRWSCSVARCQTTILSCAPSQASVTRCRRRCSASVMAGPRCHCTAPRPASLTRFAGPSTAVAGSSGSISTGSPARRARRGLQRGDLAARRTRCVDPSTAVRRLPAQRDLHHRAGAICRHSGAGAGDRFMSGAELIPSARRLMESLRDIGYDLPAAVADLVDNSIDADAEHVRIDVGHDREGGWLRIADDGIGMTERQLEEAMRYGSSRSYGGE